MNDKKEKIEIYLAPEKKEEIRRAAKAAGQTMSSFVKGIVFDRINKEGK